MDDRAVAAAAHAPSPQAAPTGATAGDVLSNCSTSTDSSPSTTTSAAVADAAGSQPGEAAAESAAAIPTADTTMQISALSSPSRPQRPGGAATIAGSEASGGDGGKELTGAGRVGRGSSSGTSRSSSAEPNATDDLRRAPPVVRRLDLRGVVLATPPHSGQARSSGNATIAGGSRSHSHCPVASLPIRKHHFQDPIGACTARSCSGPSRFELQQQQRSPPRFESYEELKQRVKAEFESYKEPPRAAHFPVLVTERALLQHSADSAAIPFSSRSHSAAPTMSRSVSAAQERGRRTGTRGSRSSSIAASTRGAQSVESVADAARESHSSSVAQVTAHAVPARAAVIRRAVVERPRWDAAVPLSYEDSAEMYAVSGGVGDVSRIARSGNAAGVGFRLTTPRLYVKPALQVDAPAKITGVVDEIRHKGNAGVGFCMTSSRCSTVRYGTQRVAVRPLRAVQTKPAVWLKDTAAQGRSQRAAARLFAELLGVLLDAALAELAALADDAQLDAALRQRYGYNDRRQREMARKVVRRGGCGVSADNPAVRELHSRLASTALTSAFALPPPEFPVTREEAAARDSIEFRRAQTAMWTDHIRRELEARDFQAEAELAALIPEVKRVLTAAAANLGRRR